MKSLLKRIINGFLAHMNLKVIRNDVSVISGINLFADLKVLLKTESPVCLDVGANIGQTIDNLLKAFQDPCIFSFEPSESTFKILSSKKYTKRVNLYNYALGSEAKELEFINYNKANLSSFLAMDQDRENRFRKVVERSRETVKVETVDYFLSKKGIGKIDLLKIDTQGYDLEVLSGGANALEHGLIRFVLVEINFVKMYKGQASSDELLSLLRRKGYYLIDLYEKERQQNTLAWCTALFGRRD